MRLIPLLPSPPPPHQLDVYPRTVVSSEMGAYIVDFLVPCGMLALLSLIMIVDRGRQELFRRLE